jgi:hypothetical protein
MITNLERKGQVEIRRDGGQVELKEGSQSKK